MRWILLLLIIIPITEVYVLIYLSKFIGFWFTLLSTILIGLWGFHLARTQGFLLFVAVRRELALGRVPGNEVLEGLVIVAAGLLLITPGLITDTVGILLLIPRIRVYIRDLIKLWLLKRVKLGVWKLNYRKN